jgi:hypothetical protein
VPSGQEPAESVWIVSNDMTETSESSLGQHSTLLNQRRYAYESSQVVPGGPLVQDDGSRRVTCAHDLGIGAGRPRSLLFLPSDRVSGSLFGGVRHWSARSAQPHARLHEDGLSLKG